MTDKQRQMIEDAGHIRDAVGWARDVVDGKVLACRWVKLACERHFRDMARVPDADWPYEFNQVSAHRVIAFIELLPHTKGKWARRQPVTGQPQRLKLEPWQKFVLAMIFGWVKKANGKRRFDKARIYIPRKNGKSMLAAGIGLWMLGKDGEPGAEVYSGATCEKQAWEVFRPAKQMCLTQPKLPQALGITINAQSLVVEADDSKFLPVIGKPGDGSSPHCAIVDEYHEHKTSDLIDTMETGMGARDQPLSLVISTAGADIKSPCREDWIECERLLENAEGFQNESTFAIIFTIDKDDQWDTEEALKKANPNWGVSINEARLLAELSAAKQSARKQSPFRTKYLNQWVTAKEGFFNIVEWDALAKPGIKPEDFKEFPCFLAGDLASKHDLVALMQLFCLPEKRFAVFGRYYIPESTLDLPENQHYRNWHIQGHIQVAGDAVTDLDAFTSDTLDICRDYQVEEMPSDPNRAWGVYPALVREGVPIVEYRNTVLMMSEPMKELDSMIRSGRIMHNGDPVLAWAIANVTAKMDLKDNVFPNKESPANKIDPVVALIMAVGRAMLKNDEPGGPVFSW